MSTDLGFNPSFNMATIKHVINEAVEKVRMQQPMRLRDLIRQIRSARTAAEERSIVNKECAYIRSTFREEDTVWRCRNIAKLLYIHMLGYPAHFGQLECLKLIASSRFIDKRIGYLGVMLLLDERQDVHVLMTNSLKNDLQSNSQYVVGLALCALGAIASPEMSRDLATEIDRLMKSQNHNIKKKAILCAFRIIKRVPDLLEIFLPTTKTLLSDKNHGVLITGITLITEMCEKSPDALDHFRKIVPNLVRILKNLILAGYSPDHDVSGISDPFLQVKILRLLRVLGKNDSDASESMNDILAQVATNTETTKNVGNTILYETVQTIMHINSDCGLRVLGINILGRFLLNSDKNIRYVALNTLLRTVSVDTMAVQRHRTTILECLKDPDVSIRRRAMELSFALINEQNVSTILKELLAFLETCEPDFKDSCAFSIITCIEKYSVNKKWQFDTLLHVLTATGNYVRDDVVSYTIQLISSATIDQNYMVKQMWFALKNNVTCNNQPLLQVAIWTIGEFGDSLMNEDSELSNNRKVFEDEVLDIYRELLFLPQTSVTTKEYILVSLMKLSTRIRYSTQKIIELVDLFGTNLHVELQQRSVEFATLFKNYNELRSGLFERMPVIEAKSSNNDLISGHDNANGIDFNESVREQSVNTQNESNNSNISTEKSKNDNLSLLLDLISESESSTSTFHEPTSISSNKSQMNVFDLLGDFSTNSNSNSDVTICSSNTDMLARDSEYVIDDVLSRNESQQEEHQQKPKSDLSGFIENSLDNLSLEKKLSSLSVLDKRNLKITFNLEKSADSQTLIVLMTAKNNSTSVFSDFLFEAAVPKVFQLTLLPPSSSVIVPSGQLTQILHVTNPNKMSILRMKLRISYMADNKKILDQVEVNNFPQNIWA